MGPQCQVHFCGTWWQVVRKPSSEEKGVIIWVWISGSIVVLLRKNSGPETGLRRRNNEFTFVHEKHEAPVVVGGRY